MSRFFSSRLSSIEPYVPGEQPRGVDYIKLNTNESPFPPSPKVTEALNSCETGRLNLYSDPTARVLVEAIAGRFGVQEENVFVGNGSDEVLAFAFDAFGEHGFATSEIAYGFYPVFAAFFGIPLRTVPLENDLSIDMGKFYSVRENIVLANPNAQTGLYQPKDRIEEMVREDRNRLVIVDEAYIDFGGESVIPLTREYDNLLVVQTFSKSRNLAGARIGFAVGNAALIEDLNTLKYSFNPYNLNRLSILAGSAAIHDEAYFTRCTGQIVQTREETKLQLRALGFRVTESLANFVLAETPRMGGEELYLALKQKGILVRHLPDARIRNYIRITVGTREQMQCLLAALKEIL